MRKTHWQILQITKFYAVSTKSLKNFCAILLSHLARGAWIEILPSCATFLVNASHLVRGVRIDSFTNLTMLKCWIFVVFSEIY